MIKFRIRHGFLYQRVDFIYFQCSTSIALLTSLHLNSHIEIIGVAEVPGGCKMISARFIFKVPEFLAPVNSIFKDGPARHAAIASVLNSTLEYIRTLQIQLSSNKKLRYVENRRKYMQKEDEMIPCMRPNSRKNTCYC